MYGQWERIIDYPDFLTAQPNNTDQKIENKKANASSAKRKTDVILQMRQSLKIEVVKLNLIFHEYFCVWLTRHRHALSLLLLSSRLHRQYILNIHLSKMMICCFNWKCSNPEFAWRTLLAKATCEFTSLIH